jgi:uncharacterized protein (UPF0261 family)
MSKKTILIVGTYDTKDEELEYISDSIVSMGGNVLKMDVSVLGEAKGKTDFSKHTVAEAAGKSIKTAIESGSEHIAMNIMSEGASNLASTLHSKGKFDMLLLMSINIFLIAIVIVVIIFDNIVIMFGHRLICR